MPDEDIWSWSTTAANNGTADTGIAWPEGQTRASVNNSARAMMAAHAKDRDLRTGAITVTGAVNALTFLSGLNYTTTPVGLTARLKIPEALLNTGPCTLEMDARGPFMIIDNLGNTLGGGELIGYQEFRWDGTNWILMNVVAGFSTGDVKLTIKNVGDAGWLLMDDTTMGSASSGAVHADANTEQLFNLLFNNITDTWAPILTSGAVATTRAAQGSAAAAWTSNCQMTLPKVLGRSLAVAGAGVGLQTPRVLGSTAGAETVTQTIAQMAPHSHTFGGGVNIAITNLAFVGSLEPSGVHFGAAPMDNAGGGAPMNVLDPSLFLNVMIKL